MNPKNPHNLTEEQIRQGYSTIPGAYDPVTGKLKSPNVITPQDLQPQPKIELPTTPVTVQTQVLNNPYTEYLKSFDLTQSEQQAKDIQMGGLDQYLKDIIGTQGETQAKAEELAKTDYTKLRRDLVTAENRWRELEAEKAKDDITLASQLRAEERRDTLLPFAQMGQAKLAGDAQIVRALKSAEQNMLNARTLALQGNIELAKQTAEEAVALKYAPYKDRIKTYEDIVKAVQPFLNSAEKKELAKQTANGNIAMKEIEKAEEEEKSIQSIALKIAENGGDPSLVGKAKTVNEALSLAKNYLQKKDIELKEINGALYAIDKNTLSVKYIGGGTTTSSGTPNIYGDVINTIIGSGKFTKDQASAIRNSISNGEEPFSVIKNQAKGLMTGANQTKVESYETAQKALQDIQSQLRQYYRMGGNTNIFKGKYETVVNKLGEVSDPRLVDLAVQIQTSLQVYRNAVSGTAYSVQEGKDIASIFPGINKTQGLNEAILSGRMKAFESTIDGAYEGILGQKTYQSMKNFSTNKAKGGLSDKEFVEKSLISNGINYEKMVNDASKYPGQIPVIDNETGEAGWIPFQEFNSSKYTKI